MTEKLTPAMKQYYDMKKEYPNSILFFRMGDFYEMFDEDAEIASRELGLTLTSRNKNAERPTPLAGIPFHAADKYLAQLTKKGYSVALCEQTSDPKLPGIVQRSVVRVITPGTTLQEEVLNGNMNNYICSITLGNEDGLCHIALCDMSTGSVYLTSRMFGEELKSYLYIMSPSEIILSQDNDSSELKDLCIHLCPCTTVRPHPKDPQRAVHTWYNKRNTNLGLVEKELSKEHATPLALILTYIEETQKQQIPHLKLPLIQHVDGTMRLDEQAVRHLELLYTTRDGKREGSLIHFLDHTTTGAGARLLRSWLVQPLTSVEHISARLEKVTLFHDHQDLCLSLRQSLKHSYDLERLIARLSMGRGNARDFLAIASTLEQVRDICETLSAHDHPSSKLLGKTWEDLVETSPITELINSIQSTIVPEPPLSITEGGFIQDGRDSTIDELRYIRTHAQEWLLSYQEQEQSAHGISTLKVKFNNVFGYFIEISKTHVHKAPTHYIRKQTTVHGERYTTPELKTYEEKILTAEDQIQKREYELFEQLRTQAMENIGTLLAIAEACAHLDVTTTLGLVAHTHHWIAPTFSSSRITHIVQGRHPIVEAYLRSQHEQYTPNDCTISEEKGLFLLLTGPNMAGKSTYMRQCAIITLLAQLGSFVPAASAELSIKDALFTRVGASDHVGGGQSTFMVEMQEMAHILRHATSNSLVILDEVGRGTSTYDGLSLAWAIMEYMHHQTKAHTIFATHYHELISVAEQLPHGRNISLAVAEHERGVTFLHHIVEKGASRSYGIEVAQRAGLPQEIISQARSYLHQLEQQPQKKKQGPPQPSLFEHTPSPIIKEIPHPLIEELKHLSLNDMTPIQALNWISEQKRKLS